VCRKENSAFAPLAQQKILKLDERVLAICRENKQDHQTVICLTNVSDEHVDIDLPADFIAEGEVFTDLITGKVFYKNRGTVKLLLQPYQTYWMEK